MSDRRSDEAQRHAERLQQVLDLARAVNSSRSLSDLLLACFRGLERAVPHDEAFLAIEEGADLRAFLMAQANDRLVELIFGPEDAPLTRAVLARDAPLLLEDMNDPATQAAHPFKTYTPDPDEPDDMRSCLCVLVRAPSVRGVLSLQSRAPGAFGPDDLEHLATLAELIGVAFERVRWQEREALRQSLARVGQYTGDGDAFFVELLRTTASAFRAPHAAVLENDGGRWICRAALNEGKGRDVPAASQVEALATDRAEIRTSDGPAGALCQDWGVKNVLVVPLRAQELRCLVLFGGASPFTQHDLSRADFLLEESAPYLQNVLLYRRLAEEAVRDPLTGTFNRRYFMLKASEALARAGRYGENLAILVVDLQRFSEVNNNHGHQVGDRVLRSVAQTMQRNLRASDHLFRIGGDEFVLLLPHADRDAAYRAAHRMAEALSDDAELSAFDVGANVGCAVFPIDGGDLDALLEVGDRRMYAAKARQLSVVEPGRTERPPPMPE